MVTIPVLGRLFWYVLHYSFYQPLTNVPRREYIALAGSLILIFLEGLIRVITLGLRKASTDSSLVRLSDPFKPNQSFDSVTIGPRISSTYSPLHKLVNQGRDRSQLLRQSQVPRILWIYVLCLATTRKSTSCRRRMDTYLGYIVFV